MKTERFSNRNPDGRTLAWGGLLTALSVIFVFAASAAPTANAALFAIASLCTAIAVVRLGSRAAATVVAASSLLAAFWPGFMLAIPYYCLFGPYPIVKALIEKKTNKHLPALAFKLAAATFMSCLAIILTTQLAGLSLNDIVTLPFGLKLSTGLFWLVAVIVMEAVLLAYDFGLTLLITWYMKHMHSRF